MMFHNCFFNDNNNFGIAFARFVLILVAYSEYIKLQSSTKEEKVMTET